MPYSMLFQVCVWLFALIFVAREFDMGRMMEARTIVQGGLDAAVLAGAHMREKVIVRTDTDGRPTDWEYRIDPDSANRKAYDNWYRNVENFYGTPIYELADVQNLHFSFSPDGKEIRVDVLMTMKPTASANLIKSIFGEAYDADEVEIPIKAIAKINPKSGKIISVP